jgi:Leucine-rich repeat (LRR) protein
MTRRTPTDLRPPFPPTLLQVLHVNDNYLTSLSGLEACPLLVEVQAARNDLTGVGAALAAHSHLTHLNLADNRICSFKVCVGGGGGGGGGEGG